MSMIARMNESSGVRRSAPASNEAPESEPAAPAATEPQDQYQGPSAAPVVNLSGGVSPDSANVEGSAGVEGTANVGGATIGGGLEVSANFESEVTREDGMVTFTVSAEASLTASGEIAVEGKKVGGSVSASHTEGTNATYEVTMSEADFERFQNGEIPVPNPADPSTIPDGGSVRLDTANIESDELSASVAYHGAEVSVGASGSESEGTSVQLSRDGDDVTVTAGPTSAFTSGITAGLSVGPVEVSAGNQTSYEDVRLKTATFDTGSPEGQEEYQRYLNTGEIPSGDRPGVTDAGIIERASYSSESSVDAGAFGLNVTVDGASTSGTRTSFIQEDGVRVDDISLNYGAATLNIHNETNEYGDKDYDKSYHELVFTETDDATREQLVLAFSGDEELAEELAGSDEPITVRLSQDQLTELRRLAEDRANDDDTGLAYWQVLTDGKSNDDFALALADSFSTGQLASELNSLAYATDTSNLPGTVVS